MADKNFKVKNKLVIAGLTNANGVLLAENHALDSHTNLATQYGGTGTTTSPTTGQIPYSSAGATYSPVALNTLDVKGSSYSDNAPSSPVIGQIWIESDSTSGTFDPNIIRRHTFTATAGQTAFVASVAFLDGYEQVYFNGLLLLKTIDYTTSSNTTVTLGSAAAAGDIIEIVTITNLNSQNTYTQAEINTIVDTQINNLIASAPAALNTLDELAAALGDDASFATTTATSIGNKVSKAGGDIITSSLASTIPLVLKGAASQTANLTQWQDSVGNVLTRVQADGTISWGGAGSALQNSSGRLIVNPSSASVIAVTVKGAVSQTANLTEWQDSAGTVKALVGSIGNAVFNGIRSGSGSTTGAINAYTTAAQIGILVRGAASQTANLQEWQISDGTVRARINSDGHIIGSTRSAFGTSAIISGVVVAAVADASTAIPLVVKGAASQTANLQEWQNSAGTVITRVRPDGQIGVGSTLITSTNFFVNNTFSTTHVVATIRGAASQTANLQEWQDSAGTVLAKIDASGSMFTTTAAANTNTTQVATTAYVQTELADLVNSAPATLDTLNELAAALGDDASFATTVTNSLANKKTEISSAISANTTLVAGRRYFVTSSSALTLTLPASPSQNDQVDIFDASGNAATYNITLGRNSSLINGNAGNFIIDANGYWATLVYTGATYGWKVG